MKKLTIRNFISQGVSLDGEIRADSSVRIDGTFKGRISIAPAHGLIIGPTGEVDGQIEAGGVIVLGKFKGKITANAVEIRKGGNVEGEIFYKALEIFSGGLFKGKSESIEERQA